MTSNNPLKGYMRNPKINFKLPSEYKFNSIGKDITPNMSGEISCKALSAKDELVLKNPDSLLSGDAIEKMILSCVPEIKNARDLPYPDIQTILLGIRYATSGDVLEFEVDCPSCKEKNNIKTSIRYILDNIIPMNNDNKVYLDEEKLEIYVKPFTLKTMNSIMLMKFEQEKLLLTLSQITGLDDEVRKKEFSESFEKLANLKFDSLVECILSVKLPENLGEVQQVTEKQFIKEFLNDCKKDTIDKIEEKISELTECGVDKKMQVTCSHCNHEWETEVGYSPTDFFGERF